MRMYPNINQLISSYNHYSYAEGSRGIEGIVIHYVGAISTAADNAKYFAGGNRNASAHYFVDRKEVWQSVLDKDAAWHCGGGPFSQGGGSSWGSILGNTNTIGIEMCCEDIGGYVCVPWETLVHTGKLVRGLIKRYGIDPAKVVRHYDITGKDCPAWIEINGHAESGINDDNWFACWCELTQGGTTGTDFGEGTVDVKPAETSDFAAGTYVCTVPSLNVRTEPNTFSDIVAHYNRGQTVNLDGWYTVNEGYVWGRYIGATSGEYRYVAVGRWTGKPESDDYLVLA